MKDLYLVLIVLFVFPFGGFSQGENDNWYFGHNAAVNFSSGTPVSVSGSQMSTGEGVASVSDSNGNLLFYTDGRTVWDSSHSPMVNGNNTLTSSGNDAAQGVVIVPYPNQPNKYFIFTTNGGFVLPGEGASYDYCAYSIVDMTKQGGLGEVTVLNVPLKDQNGSTTWSRLVENITVVNNNNLNYWVLIGYQNHLLAYPVDGSGVNVNPVVSSINYVGNLVSQIKVSPSQNLLAITEYSGRRSTLYNFDETSGAVVGAPIGIFQIQSGNNNPNLGIYSAEFSNQNNILWLSIYGNPKVYGFDINNLTANPTVLSPNNPLSIEFGTLQYGPNGKLYLAMRGTDYLAQIVNSNSLTNSYLNSDALSLGGKIGGLGLPQLVQPKIYSCQGTSITLSIPETNTSGYVYQYSDHITTNQNYMISNNQNIILKAGNYIEFLPNSYFKQGSTVLAQIEPCASLKPSLFPNSKTEKITYINLKVESSPLKLNIYPNPVIDMLNIELPDDMEMESAVLYTLMGKQIDISVESNILNMSSLASGVYILKLETSKGILTKKIVKK